MNSYQYNEMGAAAAFIAVPSVISSVGHIMSCYYPIIILIFLLINAVIKVKSLYIPDDNIAEETQHAVCKILTQEIETTANATITRQLKGVCTTKYMDFKIKQLETRLLNELNQIKIIVLGINENSTAAASKRNLEINSLFEYDNNNKIINDEEIIDDDESYVEELITVTRNAGNNTRDQEIMQYNDTVQIINNENVFIYYWRIEDISEVLQKTGIYIKSPVINILGHQLYMQLYPHHHETTSVGIQLRPTSNFFKEHKIAILNQFDKAKDISSQVLGGINSQYEPMYRVSNEKLEQQFLHQNSLIIKIVVNKIEVCRKNYKADSCK